MATFAEVEDLRDWFIDNCGEMCAKVNALDGDEPAGIIAQIKDKARQMNLNGLEVIKCLDALLVEKKKDEYS